MKHVITTVTWLAVMWFTYDHGYKSGFRDGVVGTAKLVEQFIADDYSTKANDI